MVAKIVYVVAAGASAVNAACVFPYAGQYGNGVASILTPNTVDYPTIGQPYAVKYDGRNIGSTLTFVLLRGPGENIIEQGPIATVTNCGLENCSFEWTPAATLEPDTTHYGLKLVDESNCFYQYTTQFGLHAPAGYVSSAVAASASVASAKPSSVVSKPSSYAAKPSSLVAKPSVYPGKHDDEEDCDDEEEHKPTWSAAPYASAPAVPYGGKTDGYKATNATATGYTGPQASGSYTGPMSNNAGRFAISAFGAVVAFAAAVMVL